MPYQKHQKRTKQTTDGWTTISLSHRSRNRPSESPGTPQPPETPLPVLLQQFAARQRSWRASAERAAFLSALGLKPGTPSLTNDHDTEEASSTSSGLVAGADPSCAARDAEASISKDTDRLTSDTVSIPESKGNPSARTTDTQNASLTHTQHTSSPTSHPQAPPLKPTTGPDKGQTSAVLLGLGTPSSDPSGWRSNTLWQAALFSDLCDALQIPAGSRFAQDPVFNDVDRSFVREALGAEVLASPAAFELKGVCLWVVPHVGVDVFLPHLGVKVPEDRGEDGVTERDIPGGDQRAREDQTSGGTPGEKHSQDPERNMSVLEKDVEGSGWGGPGWVLCNDLEEWFLSRGLEGAHLDGGRSKESRGETREWWTRSEVRRVKVPIFPADGVAFSGLSCYVLPTASSHRNVNQGHG